MDQWQLDNLVRKLQIVRYLLKKADERGYTHGEKHHILQVCLGEVDTVIWAMHSELDHGTQPNQDEARAIENVSDIPF